ncbi:hypothetical protein [Actinomycetospora termitidis]|uniref:Uncharacterized protein n=1 Tax=Actinomycetospora termitidis TaxID=3053470 RepID=A0ABT7MGZ0_9PSEU|nr:hypothetical protein [Actinomycetospora sp. Odt1-22]MDL5159953.1 hypothetical protein [Actinomycetospora sp. Odt1-22]
MRSVIRLRTRPGRPIWQLTTRPSTAVVLALVSLAAAGVQVALFSSPTPWYQVAVVAFWAVVGVAFVVSALGTRSRARRAAAAAAARPPVDPMPFVPVPVRPARPRRRDEPAAPAAEVGEPTTPVAAVDPAPAPARPTPSARRPEPVAAAPSRRGRADEGSTTTVPRPTPEPRRPAAVEDRASAVTARHAVRAVALVESVSRPVAVPAEVVAAADSRRSASRRTASPRPTTAETLAIRDGRVRVPDRIDGAGRRSAAPAERATGGGRRRRAEEPSPAPRVAGAAPTGSVPSPRPAPREERPGRATRPAPARRPGSSVPAESPDGRRSAHSRRTAAQARETPVPTPGPASTRRQDVASSVETTAPFGGGMTFGGSATPAVAEPSPDAWAPAPRASEPEPLTGRHASIAAAPGESVPRGAAARHAVAAGPGRRRAG